METEIDIKEESIELYENDLNSEAAWKDKQAFKESCSTNLSSANPSSSNIIHNNFDFNINIHEIKIERDRNKTKIRGNNSYQDEETLLRTIKESSFQKLENSEIKKGYELIQIIPFMKDNEDIVSVIDESLIGAENSRKDKDEIKKIEGLKNFKKRNNNLKKLFMCALCTYKTDCKTDFHKHFLIHSKTQLFKCSVCDFQSNWKCSLNMHLLTHSIVKLFNCPECEGKCICRRNLKKDLLTHSSIKLFECSECDYACNYEKDLKMHLVTHSRKKCRVSGQRSVRLLTVNHNIKE